MIVTVTLNAAIDKTYYMDRFELGKVSRVRTMHAVPGGKGINVARVIHQLGAESLASGYVGGSNGDFIERELDKQGIRRDFVRVNGESRLCLNIIDESDQSSTEILEQGPVIEPVQVEEMKRKIRELAGKSEIVSFSGSIPRGTQTSIYAELIETAKAAGARTFLDSSGDALLNGIKAKPFFIKPNEDEVEKLIGKKLERESDLYGSILELMNQGIGCVAVSLGAEGSVAGFEGKLYRIRAPHLKAINAVGCGDSFVAGMAAAMAGGQSILDCLRLATSAGSANALTAEAGNVRIADVERLKTEVVISEI